MLVSRTRGDARALRPGHVATLIAAAALLALLSGCASRSATSPPKPAEHASSRALLKQYRAMVHKLESPRLVARRLLRDAKEKRGSGRAIMAALLSLRAGDYTTAAKAASLLRKIDPGASETWSVTLRVALTRGNLERAAKAIRKAYATGGTKAVSTGLKGAIDPWFVYPLVMHLAQAHPQDDSLSLLLARSAMAADAPNAALAAARKASGFGPGGRAARLIAIQSLWGLGRHEQALHEAAEALAAHPHDIGLRVFYANMLAQEGQRRQALEVLGDARALAPRDDPRVMFGYALVAAALGNADKARRKLTTMLEHGYGDQGVYSLLGQLAENAGHWAEAFGWYQQIRDPADTATSRVAALFALYHWKGSRDALAYLAQLQARFPGLSPIWAGVHAQLARRAGREKTAWSILTEALARYPKVRPLRYQRALLAARLGKSDAALAALRKLVMAAPNNPIYLNAYGFTLTEQTTRYRKAYGYIQRALQIMPHDGAILDSMGWVLYRLEQPRKAAEYLRRAWHKTDDVKVARHLVKVYVALERFDDAREVLSQALGLKPQDRQLLKLKHRLNAARQ